MAPIRLIDPLEPHFLLYRNAPSDDPNAFQQALAGDGATDHGLRFTKFFGRWKRSNGSTELIKSVNTREPQNNRPDMEGFKPTTPLLDWLDPRKPGDHYRIPGKPFETLKAGQPERLSEANRRLQTLAARGGKYLKLSLVSRLLIGIGLPHPIENGFLFHPTLGVPYLPGSALKQVARDWAEEEQLDGDELNRLFGHPEKGLGCIAFLDALPLTPLTLTAEQITNHYPGYYQGIDNPANPPAQRDDMQQPADWYEPNPVTLLAVEATLSSPAPFGFALLPLRGASSEDLVQVANWLQQGLKIYGVGARTTLGFGRLENEQSIQARRQRQQQMRREMDAQEREMARAAPPTVGERMNHPELFVVEILEIIGDQARVYSLDFAEEETVPLSELTRR